MINLKNIVYGSGTQSMYYILVQIVLICGLDSVLSALTEIVSEMYVQRLGELNDDMTRRMVIINNQKYSIDILPSNYRDN